MLMSWLLSAILLAGGVYQFNAQEIIEINPEIVDAFQSSITIAENNDLHIRLRNPTSFPSTCYVTRPDGSTANSEPAPDLAESCGFIIRNIQRADQGIWSIVFGNDHSFTAPIKVTVTDRWDAQLQNLAFLKDRSVDLLIGPEDAVYCRIEDPRGATVFDGFGRCHLVLERVTFDHSGTWKLVVGSPGRVLTDEYQFLVAVTEATRNAVVTHVAKEQPRVILTCTVTTDEEVRGCKFRDPTGRVLLASQGVGEDRFNFHGAGETLQSNVQSHECGLRINDPITSDLGLWRCAVETDKNTYYGFLTVLCPWSMSIPEIAAQVQAEPVLRTQTAIVNSLEGQSVTLSCSIESALRYCYFRARNGTVYSVSPGNTDLSAPFQYAGAGFEAGECAIRFPTLHARDSGAWSCHVGFHDHTEPEQRIPMTVTVEEAMTYSQVVVDNVLIVRGLIHGGRQLEYCRFVRMDGLGFTTENLPERYESRSDLPGGVCELRVPNPTILEVHPWTVVARIRGQDVELESYTPGSFPTAPPPPPPPTPNSGFVWWLLVIMICLIVLVFGCCLCPKKNRKWLSNRASSIRSSVRNSIRKKPLDEPNRQNNPNMPA